MGWPAQMRPSTGNARRRAAVLQCVFGLARIFFLSLVLGFGPFPSCVARFALPCALQPRTFHPFAVTLCCGVRRFNSVPGPTNLDFCRTAPFLCTVETAGTFRGVKSTHSFSRAIVRTVPRAANRIDRSKGVGWSAVCATLCPLFPFRTSRRAYQ